MALSDVDVAACQVVTVTPRPEYRASSSQHQGPANSRRSWRSGNAWVILKGTNVVVQVKNHSFGVYLISWDHINFMEPKVVYKWVSMVNVDYLHEN